MFIIYLFVIGLAVGSFLNVLIDRLPHEESIMGRSRCDYCKKNLRAYDLIPLISYIYYDGKSRCCNKELSFYYPCVELLTGISFIIIFYLLPVNLWTTFHLQSLIVLLSWFGLISSLIVIFFADLKYHIIPDQATISLILFSIPIAISQNTIAAQFTAGIILFLTLLILFVLTRGKGLGFGDVKLAFAIGWLLGLKSGFIALYIAFILGGLMGIGLLFMQKRGLKSKIAFGPFLIIGLISMLFFNGPILDLIQQIFSL